MSGSADMQGRRVAVAMSGGLDSAVSAALLVDQGADVFGLSAKTWPGGSRCCSDEDIRCAQRMADALGIPHYVIDLHEAFERVVVHYFADEYVQGRTPSPCAVCNRRIKFGDLLERALALGAEVVATGHYARIEKEGDRYRLLRGSDRGKDQSYFLFDLSQGQLSRTLFPVGGMQKDESRAYASERGLPVGTRGESQDLCFVAEGEHWALTEKMRPDVCRPGGIIDLNGTVLGQHDGIHRFTVGQRKGIGIATGTPMYVRSLDAETNRVIVAPREELLSTVATVRDVRWTSGDVKSAPFRAETKVRYAQNAAPSTVTPSADGATVTFDDPQFAITPGQVAAFYDHDELVGGGWID